eukprot:GFUD01000401.1.p1 GENE.GFUD01000401.1~~GFUD01000401.1.p1  ORF type:complete len:373 (+),score=71.57 GFUD01000401.1:22-1119(+)
MQKLSRIPTQDFDRDVTAVAMDDRFILVGQADGSLSAVYHKNGIKVFSVKISDCEITAVCCEEQDEDSNQIFYAGDSASNIFTVNKKGQILAQVQLKARKGKIHTIVNHSRFTIHVLSAVGSTTFSQGTHKLKKGRFSSESGKYSIDGDGTFNKKAGTGDYKVNQYDCRNATNTIATFRIKFGKKLNNYRQVFAYATFDEDFINLIEEGTAETTLAVYCPNNRLVRTVEFPAPVKQVMSCRHHRGRAEEDKIFILLWNGHLVKVSGSLLEDPEIGNDALDMATVFMGADEEEDDDGEFKGFCVHSKKIVIYGYDGLHTLDLSKRRKSHKSLRVIKQRVVNPIFSWFQAPHFGFKWGLAGVTGERL